MGSNRFTEEIPLPSPHHTPGVPVQLATAQPARWDCYRLPDTPPVEIGLVHRHMRVANERFGLVGPRSKRYEVIYGAVATFSDGSYSNVSLNIPPITAVNRCAESGLVAHIEGREALAEEQRTIKRITLMGLFLGDDSLGFNTHPNPCARCRDRLQVLASLGKIDSDTEILIIALNRDGSLPREGRLTSYGDLLVSSEARVDVSEVGVLALRRAATVTALIDQLKAHFAGVPFDTDSLKEKLARGLRALQRRKDTSIVAGISPKGLLELATARPSVVLFHGKAQRFSAETGGVVAAIIEEWDNLFFLNFSTARKPSSVAMQRFLDVLHHLHTKKASVQVKILQVSPDSSHRGRFFLDEVDPRRAFPLGEGPLHRGRCSLIETEKGQLSFSSKLGVGRYVVAKLLKGIEIERVASTAEGERFGYWRKSLQEKLIQVENVLGGPVSNSSIPHLRVTQSPHCADPAENPDLFELIPVERITGRLMQMLNGAENLQKRTCPRGNTRPPLLAVLGSTNSGELVPRFEFVSPCPTGYEEHGVDPIIQALAELLHETEPGTGPDALHLAWRAGEPMWSQEHEGLLRGVEEVTGKKIRLFAHFTPS